MLYLVPTPIGNLSDMTYRAVTTLKEVDLVLAEDTRTSKRLFVHYEIDTPLESFHAHNEHARLDHYTELIRGGTSVALITDAGTPGISDPGFLLVRRCREEEIAVTCLPGASAIIPAVAASGIPCDKFYFEGFLPHKKGRHTRLTHISSMPMTTVLYESPHRLLRCLKEISEYCGADRQVCVVREISKIHEEYTYGTVTEVYTDYENRPSVKGEIVIVVAGGQK